MHRGTVDERLNFHTLFYFHISILCLKLIISSKLLYNTTRTHIGLFLIVPQVCYSFISSQTELVKFIIIDEFCSSSSLIYSPHYKPPLLLSWKHQRPHNLSLSNCSCRARLIYCKKIMAAKLIPLRFKDTEGM